MTAPTTRNRALWINLIGISAAVLVLAAWAWQGSLLSSPRDITYVIPRGTADLIAAGSGTVIPQEISLIAGDRLVFTNEDIEDHRVGGIYVSAGSTVTARFRNPGTFEYICSVHPSGHTVFEIAERKGTAVLGWASLAMVGLLAQVNGIVFGGWSRKQSAVLLGAGAIAMFVGVAFALDSSGVLTSKGPANTNPIPASSESIATGSVTFQQFCVNCHGTGGRGDGSLAPGLDPAPADLIVHIPLHPDNVLYRFVQDGIPGSSMTGLKDALDEEEIWHLVNYLRTLP
jgi:mono/diheme cytochrome c family protein